jgi:hypothetical protein
MPLFSFLWCYAPPNIRWRVVFMPVPIEWLVAKQPNTNKHLQKTKHCTLFQRAVQHHTAFLALGYRKCTKR